MLFEFTQDLKNINRRESKSTNLNIKFVGFGCGIFQNFESDTVSVGRNDMKIQLKDLRSFSTALKWKDIEDGRERRLRSKSMNETDFLTEARQDEKRILR
jgi:chemotaxis receptor (MCP) glutamine deamidase CheD